MLASTGRHSRLNRCVRDAFTEFQTKNKAEWRTTCQEAAERYAAQVRAVVVELSSFINVYCY